MSHHWLPLLGAFLLGAAVGLPSQAIRGSVVEAESGRPVPGAIVEVHDADGYLTRRVVTTSSGGFLVPLATSGRYRLGVRAIGYRPARLEAVDVELALRTIAAIRLDRAFFTLADIVTVAESGSCLMAGTDRESFADLLASFASSLTVVEQVIQYGEIEFETEIIDRQIGPASVANRRKNPGRLLDTIADTVRRDLTYWPVQSLDVDSLRRFGFAIERWQGGQGSWTLYGPDPTVLFSPWFIGSHCFSLDRPSSTADSLVLRFAPPRRSQVGEIEGELVVEASSLAPRSLRFRFAYLPVSLAGVDPKGIGGVLTFSHTPSGIWYVETWRMWSPILAGRYRTGSSERSGRVTVVRPNH